MNRFEKFIAWRIENKLSPDRHRSYGVHYNNPRTTPAQEYHVDLCVTIEQDVQPNTSGIINKVIPAGRCAVTRYIGSRKYVSVADDLCLNWLPNSGERLRDFPVFFHYVNVGPNVQENEMITDVYLPIS